MEIVSRVIPVKTRQKDEVLVMPIGDIQWFGDDKGVALKMLKRHIQWGVDHNVFFLGMGDYTDAFSPSNRQRLRGAALYNTANAIIDQKAHELVDEIYDKALAPSKGRWLGLLEGHHYHQFAAGMTTDMLLADKLQAPFLGTSTVIRLQFRRGNGKETASNHVLIWAHHGTGTGQTEASILNRLKRTATQFEADIFLMGHLPQKVNAPIDRLVPIFPPTGKPYLTHRTKILAGTGGFMKTWVVGAREGLIPRGGYGEVAMYTPAALGGVLVKIRPRWKQKEGHTIWSPDLSVEA